MGRPAVHSTDDFLDAAAKLFAEGGVRALTMSAVARAVGAPSGSIYHRFGDRAGLLSALWMRTVRNFQAGYYEVLGDNPGPQAAIDATVWMVEWCRNNLADAVVLQAGHRAFSPEEWSPTAAADWDKLNVRQRRERAARVKAIAAASGHPVDEVTFAMFQMPIAVVRPSLLAGKRPPATATRLVRKLATLILDGRSV